MKEGHLREENDLSLGSTELKSSHAASRRETGRSGSDTQMQALRNEVKAETAREGVMEREVQRRSLGETHIEGPRKGGRQARRSRREQGHGNQGETICKRKVWLTGSRW